MINQQLDRKLDKYVELVKEFIEANIVWHSNKTDETTKIRNRARQRMKRRRASLLAEGVDEKALDTAYAEAAVYVTKQHK